ncbi:MAG: aldehyde dehydrogenase family protein [Chloroflexi bacterium]|nr:aldehyde dehydrogenase family protein [Chloroflexota bacterium]
MRFKMLIDGEWTDASEGETWAVINPATEKKVADVPFGGADEASRAISAAESALPRWKAMTAYERGQILRDIADAIRAQVDQLAPIMTAECGKPLGEATGEWGACADLFDWFALYIPASIVTSAPLHNRVAQPGLPDGCKVRWTDGWARTSYRCRAVLQDP